MSEQGPNGRPSLREYLKEMHDDLKRVVAFVDAMEAQKLPERLDGLETWRDQWGGRVIGLGVIGTTLVGLMLAHLMGLGT